MMVSQRISSQKTPQFRSADEPYLPQGVGFIVDKKQEHKKFAIPKVVEPTKNIPVDSEILKRAPRAGDRGLLDSINPTISHPKVLKQAAPPVISDLRKPADQVPPEKWDSRRDSLNRSSHDHSREDQGDEGYMGEHQSHELRPKQVPYSATDLGVGLETIRSQKFGRRLDSQSERRLSNLDDYGEADTGYLNGGQAFLQEHTNRSQYENKGASNWIDDSIATIQQPIKSLQILEEEIRKTGPVGDSKVNSIIEKLLMTPSDFPTESFTRTPLKDDWRSNTSRGTPTSATRPSALRTVVPIPYRTPEDLSLHQLASLHPASSHVKSAREGGVLRLLKPEILTHTDAIWSDNFMEEGGRKWAGWDDKRSPPRPSDEYLAAAAQTAARDRHMQHHQSAGTAHTLKPMSPQQGSSNFNYNHLPEKYLARAAQKSGQPVIDQQGFWSSRYQVSTNIHTANIQKHSSRPDMATSKNSRRITALGPGLTGDTSHSPAGPTLHPATGSPHRDYRNPYSRHLS